MQSDEGEGVFITALCESVEALTVLRGNFHFLVVCATVPWQLGSGLVGANDRTQRDEVRSQKWQENLLGVQRMSSRVL